MMITTKHIAAAAILAAGLASSPALAGKDTIANGAALGNNSGAATAAIPAPKLSYKPDAFESGIRRDFEDMRGLDQFRDARVSGDLDASMGAYFGGFRSLLAGPDGMGPAMANQNEEQGVGSSDTRGGPRALASRYGDTTSSYPGSPTDGVADGSGKAGRGVTVSSDSTDENEDGESVYTVDTRSEGNDDPDDDYAETTSTTTHKDGSEDTEGSTINGDGSTAHYTSHRDADGSGWENTDFSNGVSRFRMFDKNGRTTMSVRYNRPDSQPTEGSSGWIGFDCGWNPLYGCTRGAVTQASILGKIAQPGPDDEVGNSSTGSGAPSIGPEAVTNPGEQNLSGSGGGGRPRDMRDPEGFQGGVGPGPTR